MKVLALAVLTIPTLCFAQAKYPVDCSKMSSLGCMSFNEMIEKGDKDLIVECNAYSRVYACFRRGEDVFVVITYDEPDPDHFLRTADSPYVAEQSGVIGYSRYKEGLQEDSKMAIGQWHKSLDAGTPFPWFTTSPKSPFTSRANVDKSELRFIDTFENRLKTRTTYLFDMRLSTLRFSETFEWKGNPTAKTREEREGGSDESSGYCAQLK